MEQCAEINFSRGALMHLIRPLPQPLPQAADIPDPQDREYCGPITIDVDLTDVARGIVNVSQTIPVDHSGELILLYPEWLPGYHAPRAPIELMSGLKLSAGDRVLNWNRHPTQVSAFYVEVPEGCTEILASFQFLSPTDSSQGRRVISTELLTLQWNTVVLYPAGHFARRIMVEPRLRLPDGWKIACALDQVSAACEHVQFELTALDVLIDSPVLAGRNFSRISIDDRQQVWLNVVGDRPEQVHATPEQIAPHRELVRQADLLFESRHFDRFEVLLALSDEIDSIGVEHHRSCEAVSITGYFAEWDRTFTRRDTIPHEYVHSWNGKYRRGADSWTASFDKPIRNSLMWVYEGQTQYWDRVLCARSGLWTKDQALEALAEIAATHDVRSGSRWRPLIDTTRDPIIAQRNPLPWPSWQRSEDYYTEGALIWLDVDTRIRELTAGARSLDTFAASFFGMEEGIWVTNTYTFDDVVEALQRVAPFNWSDFLEDRLNRTTPGAPLEGIERGGYRLVYKDQPTSYQASKEALTGTANLLFSIGLQVCSDGRISEVLWESPAFHAGLTTGMKVMSVADRSFSIGELTQAITDASNGDPIELTVSVGRQIRSISVDCRSGLQYPRLERCEGDRSLLDDILEPLRG